ncbi:hypothetical protein [Actinoplanes aureus]|uniref:Uncharacterized protein n=1 Tax=Actinoplanes aureus TaxID=2792083 RepID=A0A931CMP3_9ACTN|nr:hypothetical protein [Actinoplanes aureus]MBG0569148.1 hypothetical protein [Actinoplanes aureus]
MFNLAALLASDVGMHDLARQWCHRLARVALAQRHAGHHALEPVVNLARLLIRAGDGPGAWTMLENLFQAVSRRSDITIDGIGIPTAELTQTVEAHRELREWLWKVLLGTGSHALASAGRWDEARNRLSQHRAIGANMLDGRQIAVISHALAGRHAQADQLLRSTLPGEQWENAVTGCLTLLCTPGHRVDTSLLTHSIHPEPGLAVFWTRLGLSLIDALGTGQPDTLAVATGLLRLASTDGYAARDVLAHPVCRASAIEAQILHLQHLVDACGLDRGYLSASELTQVNNLLGRVELVISRPATQLV